MLHFYDASTPENVPSGVIAAVYINGYAWPQSEIERMSRVFCISVLGDPSFARKARCIDVEQGAGTWQDAVAFCHARHAHGHDDFTVYANLSTMQDFDGQGSSVVKVLNDHAPGLPYRLWVAAWDDNPGDRPTVDGVAAWAKQYHGAMNDPFDVSALYGVDDLVKP